MAETLVYWSGAGFGGVLATVLESLLDAKGVGTVVRAAARLVGHHMLVL